MKITPALSEIQKIAATGEYRVAPVSCEILSDFTTPIETLRVLKNVSDHVYLLESARSDDRWGRYTFLGYDPKLCISCDNGRMTLGDESFQTEDPSEHIR
ncbi:MAG: anthranilate synthase component I, partial [Lachnospiraceae bacterium]|nr:anthranilate synthase component I [Lachnospiraceae bacterium]